MQRYIIVKLDIEGVHKYPEAENYLKNLHRHIFRIIVKKEVSHNNREIEIINFKKAIKNYLIIKYGVNKSYAYQYLKFGNMSCEDIAEKILKQFNCTSVKVLEDNENGAEVTK